MKKILIVLLMITSTAYSQEFKRFSVGVGVAPIVIFPSGFSMGTQFYIEPTFRIIEKLSIAYRFDVTARFKSSSFNSENTINPILSNSFNAQYFFGNSSFKPYAGFGLALFTTLAYNYTQSGSYFSSPTFNRFGFYPRFGFQVKKLNVSIDYNVLPSLDTGLTSGNSSVSIGNSYLAMRVGIFLGGGKGK